MREIQVDVKLLEKIRTFLADAVVQYECSITSADAQDGTLWDCRIRNERVTRFDLYNREGEPVGRFNQADEIPTFMIDSVVDTDWVRQDLNLLRFCRAGLQSQIMEAIMIEFRKRSFQIQDRQIRIHREMDTEVT